ncbi:MAG: hypothetical protein Q8L02_04930 [Candidatus Nitrotoga sp.]|nr:hypothetical protein [Candidatus Nitrotoga sp.]
MAAILIFTQIGQDSKIIAPFPKKTEQTTTNLLLAGHVDAATNLMGTQLAEQVKQHAWYGLRQSDSPILEWVCIGVLTYSRSRESNVANNFHIKHTSSTPAKHFGGTIGHCIHP